MPHTSTPRSLARVLCATIALVAATLCAVAIVAARDQQTQLEKPDDASAEIVQKEDQRDEAPVKWLPDLRVLSDAPGAPTTSLNLSEILRQLCEEKRFGDNALVSPEDVEWSLVSGGDEVAEIALNGSILEINWLPNAIGKTTVVVKAEQKSDPTRRAFVSFKAELWKPNYVAILLTVLGGGGLFLLGMRRLSDGLQAMAGSRLRRLVSMFTNNCFLAVGVGAVVTTLVQSSTATTVMTLGFVNSGLMTLTQAIGVLLGANIGTTTTGWLFSLNIGALGLPILGLAAIVYIFNKNERVRNFSTFALGFGMIFFGLETLKDGLAPLPDTPQFSALMQAFQATSMKGACMCVLIGCVATFIAHSSAATLAITMTLASLGAIDLNSSAAIVLGSNIGTTLTPAIVAIGAPANTRRAAYFHIVFNSVGVLWVLALFFPIFLPTVNGLSDAFHLGITGRVALTHTIFNVVNTALFMPLIPWVARLFEKYVTDKGERASKSATGLSSFRNLEPTLAIERSRGVVQNMFGECEQMLARLKELQHGGFNDENLIKRVSSDEDKLDKIQDETIEFISRVMPRAGTTDVAASGQEQIRIAEELETISDYLLSVMKSNLKLKGNGLAVSQTYSTYFNELLDNAVDSLAWLGVNFERRNHFKLAIEMIKRRAKYVARAKEIRDDFMKSMSQEQVNPLVVIAVDYQINAWRRVYEHLLNIAEAMETPGVALQPNLRRA